MATTTNKYDFVPFAVAIADDLFFKDWFDQLSIVQQVVLKAYYGLPLISLKERHAWAILNDSCDYDELGYPTAIREFPYEPKEYEQLWAIIGRRGGKTTLIGALIFAYECILGGHMEWVLKGQEAVAVLISQVKEVALHNLSAIRLCLESSPFAKSQIVSTLADRIVLKNGITIVASAPNIKSQRGLAIPVVGMDEVGFWYKDAESANPDVEVVRAVAAAQKQFRRRKRFGISTPWSKEGLLYAHHMAGTEGRLLTDEREKRAHRGILVVEATTAAMTLGMANPHITRQDLEDDFYRDPDGFEREYLKRFVDAVSAWILRVALERAVERLKGKGELAPITAMQALERSVPAPIYVAAMDPAFRTDAYAFCVLHNEPGVGVVVDKVKRWFPERGHKLDPAFVLSDMLPILLDYGITHIYTDQYQVESLTTLFAQAGIVVEEVGLSSASKPKIMGNLESLINQNRLHLLDPKMGQDQRVMFDELLTLEKILRPNGTVSIAGRANTHDDMALALAIAAYKAAWLVPLDQPHDVLPEEHQRRTLWQRAMKHVESRREAQIRVADGEEGEDWE